MRHILTLQQKLAPELIELVERRYNILRSILLIQPVGRRVLAAKLQMGERPLRSDVDHLKEQGLIEADAAGMRITSEGEQLIRDLEEYIRALRGFAELEDKLANALGIARAIIIPGDSSLDGIVKRDIGREGARFLKEIIKDDCTLAVTGGTTLYEVAHALHVHQTREKLLVVPARGGLEEDVEYQANTIAAEIAKKFGGSYRMLHIPDNLDEEATKTLAKDPKIHSIVESIRSADILFYGVGNAMDLAQRRGLRESEIKELMARGAVGEAFGDYFNAEGKVVFSSSNIGVYLDNLDNIKQLVAVAGGSTKGKAIMSVVTSRRHLVLITDEGAAKVILETGGGDD